VEQAVEVAQKLKPRLTVLTHMGHELDYDTLSKELPGSIVPAYDGMELELPDP
jgi:phosphoribosyl 1,2-cyclic phosphate phosphodiesterase